MDRIDEEGKGTIIEDKINKLSYQIGQLKSDLSDVATLFSLLKDNKEQIANKITDTDSTSKVSEGTKSSTTGSENTGIESLTLEDIGDIRKEVIKDFKQNIVYCKRSLNNQSDSRLYLHLQSWWSSLRCN